MKLVISLPSLSLIFILGLSPAKGFASEEDFSNLGFEHQEHSLEWYRTNLINFKSKDQSFKCTGPVRLESVGTIGANELHLARYGEPKQECALVLLLSLKKSMAKPIAAWGNILFDDGVIDPPQKPELLKFGSLDILRIKRDVPGTGHMNNDQYFQVKDEAVARIDASCWESEMRARLEPGYHVWKGIRLDLTQPRQETPVWADGDGNCCSSGGKVQVDLGLKDGFFRITKFQWDPKFQYSDQPARTESPKVPPFEGWKIEGNAGYSRRLLGRIGDDNFIDLQLLQRGKTLKGTYFYTKYCSPISLEGSVSDDGMRIQLVEYDQAHKPQAEFVLAPGKPGYLSGEWKSKKVVRPLLLKYNW